MSTTIVRWRALATWLFVPALTGCSLVKLSGDIVQGHCESDADCAELNADTELGSDPCQRWQCNMEEQLCRYGALDADHDQQSPAKVMHDGKSVSCEKDPAKQDCDDGDDTTGAGFPEQCDERDNDCDGLADEDALEAKATRTVVFESAAGGRATAATDASYARDPMSGAVALGYGLLQNESARPGASLLDPALADRQSASSLSVEHIGMPLAQEVALAPLDGGRFAYALINQSGVQRLVAGVWNNGADELGVLEDVATTGVHCLADESCSDVLEPALASQGSDVLLAYLRFAGDATATNCGALQGSADGADVLLNLLARPSGDERLHEQSANALRLGQSSDLSAPALLSVPAIGKVPASFLVAYAQANGDLVIAQLRRDGKQLALLDPELIRIGDGSVRSAPMLALGPAQDGGFVLGIAHQHGCGSGSRIELDLRLLWDDGGNLAADDLAAAVSVGGASNESNPALTYSPNRDVWLVSYRDLSGLRARVLSADGSTLHGEQPYTLIARVKPADGDEVDTLPLPMAAFELGPDFAVLAHVLRAKESDPRAFETVKLRCTKN